MWVCMNRFQKIKEESKATAKKQIPFVMKRTSGITKLMAEHTTYEEISQNRIINNWRMCLDFQLFRYHLQLTHNRADSTFLYSEFGHFIRFQYIVLGLENKLRT